MQGLLALMSLSFKETLNTNQRLFKSACKSADRQINES